jgi:hypothetical protein
MSKRMRKLMYAKADRALLAIVDLIECDDKQPEDIQDLDQAADLIRAIRDRIGQVR